MTVINRVLKGAGGGKKYGADISTFLGDVDSNGILQNGNTTDLIFAGVKDIGAINPTASVLMRRFQYNTGIKSVSFPDLENLTPNYGMANTFYGCTGITSIDLSSLNTVSGEYAFNYTFYGCTGITSVNLNNLTAVTKLFGMQSIFLGCRFSSIEFPSLTTLRGDQCARQALGTNPNLKYVKFQSLQTLTGQIALASLCYNCTSLQSIWFYALNTNSFGSYTDQFNQMLSGVTGCAVHFPKAIQSKIGSWSEVTGGFSGTSTSVLFDIITSIVGADSNTYTRSEKNSTTTATAWSYNNTLYYTSGVSDNDHGVNEPSVGDTIYSDSACTTAVTTISSIA